MVIATFQVLDNLGKAQFCKESFLLVNTSMEMELQILFLFFSIAEIQFAEKELN